MLLTKNPAQTAGKFQVKYGGKNGRKKEVGDEKCVLGQDICTKKEVSQRNNSFGHPPNQEEEPKDGDKGRRRSSG
ncbi:MAG: hypothetical protein ABIK20_01845 [Candidatus Omnitrophota bacterium]